MPEVEQVQRREVALVQRLARGDHEAAAELYQAYSEAVFRFVYRRIEERYKDAEELMQDTFISAYALAAPPIRPSETAAVGSRTLRDGGDHLLAGNSPTPASTRNRRRSATSANTQAAGETEGRKTNPQSPISNPQSQPSGRPSPQHSPTTQPPTHPTTPSGREHFVRVPIGTFVAVLGTPNVRHLDAKTETPKPQTIVYLGDRIATGDADQAEIQFHDPTARATGYLGVVYEKQGKRQEAMAAYCKALGWWFDDTFAREGLERLEKK